MITIHTPDGISRYFTLGYHNQIIYLKGSEFKKKGATDNLICGVKGKGISGFEE